MKIKKKDFRRILVLSQSEILRFLVAKWVLLAKKLRRPDIFRPLQCQTRGGAGPPPKIDAYALGYFAQEYRRASLMAHIFDCTRSRNLVELSCFMIFQKIIY